jgi:hypothetical protein
MGELFVFVVATAARAGRDFAPARSGEAREMERGEAVLKARAEAGRERRDRAREISTILDEEARCLMYNGLCFESAAGREG